jgi:hypothetical protein
LKDIFGFLDAGGLGWVSNGGKMREIGWELGENEGFLTATFFFFFFYFYYYFLLLLFFFVGFFYSFF